MSTPALPVLSAGVVPEVSPRAFFHGAWHPLWVLRSGGSRRRRPVRSASSGPRRRPGAAGPSPRRRLARWLARNRRLGVALLLCVAAGLAVQQLTPAQALTV